MKNQKSKIKSQKDTSKASPKLDKKSIKDASSGSESLDKKSQAEPQTMEELLSLIGGFSNMLKKGDKVDGIVVTASAKEILIDIGRKSLGIVAEWELEQVKEYASQLKPGDKVIAHVINIENEMGYSTLSLRRASLELRWKMLVEKQKSGSDIEVNVLEVSKGGLLVDWQNLRGFVPATQLDSAFSNNPNLLINKKIKVKVLEVDSSINRLVLSQKAALLGISPKVIKDKLAKIKINDVLKGVISGIAPFGLFIDIEGLEGLVHISEIAWEKVENPNELYKVGEKVEVVVLEVNKDEGKLNLSIKRLTPDPWKNILDRYPVDSTISGKVVRIAPYGAFVNLETGIEGLIHISKIPSGLEPKSGDKVECIVEKVDPIKRKISLTFVPTTKPVGYR